MKIGNVYVNKNSDETLLISGKMNIFNKIKTEFYFLNGSRKDVVLGQEMEVGFADRWPIISANKLKTDYVKVSEL